MIYEKVLAKHGLSSADIDTLVATMRERASGGVVQPEAVYHSAAVDLALGACEMSEEVLAGMKGGDDARRWLAILTGVSV